MQCAHEQSCLLNSSLPKLETLSELKTRFFKQNYIMQSFRYFVAIGVGAAIALSLIESGAAKDVPSLSRNGKDGFCLEEAKPAQTSEVLPSFVWSKVDCSSADKKSLTLNKNIAQIALTTDRVLLTTREIGFPEIKSGEEVSVVSFDKLADTEESSIPKTDSTANGEALPTAAKNKQNQATSRSLNRNSASSEKPLSTVVSSNSTTQNNLRQPTQSPHNFQIAQSVPPAKNPAAPAPEYLNPSRNPLLFPTQSEEVQIKRREVITLEQAIELGRRNNRELQAARLTLEQNQAALQEALASEFPTAGLVLDFTRSDSASSKIGNALGAQLDPTTNFSRNPISTSFNAGLQVSYDFYTGGIRPATIRGAEQQVRFQQLDIERVSQQLRLDISLAYYNSQQADAQTRISRAAVANAEQILRDTQLQEQAGLGTRFDVLQTQVTLANANQDLTTALSQQRIARRQLVRILSLAQNSDVSAVETIVEAGAWQLSLEQTIVLAIKNRAELEQQLVQRDIFEQRRRIALGANRPQASLTAGYNILGVLNDGTGPAQGLTLGARLQWNLFDGGVARSRARQATTSIAIAENTFATQRNQIRFDAEQAFSSLDANRINIQTATFALQAAQESLRLARLRFGAGVGTNTDVINQLTALTRAQVNQLQAILDYNRSLANLQRAVSNLPDSNLFGLP